MDSEIKEEPNQKVSQTQSQMGSIVKYKFVYLLIGSLVLGLVGGFAANYAYDSYFGSNGGINPIYNRQSINIEESSAIISAADKVMPAVVSITGTTKTKSFFGTTNSAEVSGTGYIVSADGVVVTNKHVAQAVTSDYTVITNEGVSYPAKLMSTDPIFDIAILKVDAKDLPTVELGDSNSLVVGQTAIAIGNALGQYQNSVTVGVISGVGRAIQASDSTGTSTEYLDSVIQTDAAINSGNSGGPLLNVGGHVVGMNTAVDSEGQGIGFALPVNLVKSALDSYGKTGKISRAMLGVRYVSLTKDISQQNDISVNEGAYIYSQDLNLPAVVSGSPADKAGLTIGDIITYIDDEKVTETNTLVTVLAKHAPGDTVTIKWLRDDKEMSAKVKLASTE